MKRIVFRRLNQMLALAAFLLLSASAGMAQGRPQMELIETKIAATQTTIDITGQVKNISPREVSGVIVYCSFQDASGKNIRTERSQLETDPLGADETSAFKVSTKYSGEIKRFNVTFSRMFGGPLTTKDSRKQ